MPRTKPEPTNNSTSEKQHIGRPLLEIDSNLVLRLASIGCTNREIAYAVGCNVDTLHDRFSDVIHEGQHRGRISLKHAMFRKATEDHAPGDAKMMIHLAEQKEGVCSLGLNHRPANTTEPQAQPFDNRCTFAIPTDGNVVVFRGGKDIIAQIHGEVASDATKPPEPGEGSSTGNEENRK